MINRIQLTKLTIIKRGTNQLVPSILCYRKLYKFQLVDIMNGV